MPTKNVVAVNCVMNILLKINSEMLLLTRSNIRVTYSTVLAFSDPIYEHSSSSFSYYHGRLFNGLMLQRFFIFLLLAPDEK